MVLFVKNSASGGGGLQTLLVREGVQQTLQVGEGYNNLC